MSNKILSIHTVTTQADLNRFHAIFKEIIKMELPKTPNTQKRSSNGLDTLCGIIFYEDGKVIFCRSTNRYINAIGQTGIFHEVAKSIEFLKTFLKENRSRIALQMMGKRESARSFANLRRRFNEMRINISRRKIATDFDRYETFRDWYLLALYQLNCETGHSYTIDTTCALTMSSVTGLWDKTMDNMIIVDKAVNSLVNAMNEGQSIEACRSAVEKLMAVMDGSKKVMDFLKKYSEKYLTVDEDEIEKEKECLIPPITKSRWHNIKSNHRHAHFDALGWDHLEEFNDWFQQAKRDLVCSCNLQDNSDRSFSILRKTLITGSKDYAPENCILVLKSDSISFSSHMTREDGGYWLTEPDKFKKSMDDLKERYRSMPDAYEFFSNVKRTLTERQKEIHKKEPEPTTTQKNTIDGTTASQLKKIFRNEDMFYVANSENDDPVTKTMTYDESVSWIRAQGSHDVAYDIKIEVTVSHSPKVVAREIKGL